MGIHCQGQYSSTTLAMTIIKTIASLMSKIPPHPYKMIKP